MVNDLMYNLLEASHKRRTELRKLFALGHIGHGEWEFRKVRLARWTEYRINKLRSYGNG